MAVITKVYFKPLLPLGELRRELDIRETLKRIQKDLRRRIRDKLEQSVFSERAKKALARWLVIHVKESSLVIEAKHEAFKPLVLGMPRQQMKWLVKARRPIPIVTETGELIFRSATAKSMKNGKWVHPGHAKQDFVTQAKNETREFFKKKLAKELKQQLVRAWKKKFR